MIHIHGNNNTMRNIYEKKGDLQIFLEMQHNIREIETFLKIRKDGEEFKTDVKVFQSTLSLTFQAESGKINQSSPLNITILSYIESNFEEFSMKAYKKLLADCEALRPAALKELEEFYTEAKGLIV